VRVSRSTLRDSLPTAGKLGLKDSRRSTREQLVGGTVEVQLVENFFSGGKRGGSYGMILSDRLGLGLIPPVLFTVESVECLRHCGYVRFTDLDITIALPFGVENS
jgi:hypothetical protein